MDVLLPKGKKDESTRLRSVMPQVGLVWNHPRTQSQQKDPTPGKSGLIFSLLTFKLASLMLAAHGVRTGGKKTMFSEALVRWEPV